MKPEINISPLVDLLQQYKLLQQEYEYEKELFFQQTQYAGIIKRVRQGVCWHPVTVHKSYYNSLNQFTIEIRREEGEETEHNFEYGRPVCFFKSDTATGRLHYFSFTGVISYVQENSMLVVMPHSNVLLDLQGDHTLGVQLYFDGTSYKTMFSALKEVMEAKNNRLAHLREIILGNTPSQYREIPDTRFFWLNRSQEKAVNRVIRAKEIAIVHGPPGTGKTTTLVEAIYETLRRENQVLVCAQSNTAVDWISEKLLDRGVNVMRIGNPTRVNEKMLSFTYERRFESHPAYPALRNARKNIREIIAQIKKTKGDKRETLLSRLRQLREKNIELELRIEEQLFGEARVIACTLVGSANKTLNGKKFSTLFIDEAGQALEAACWIAIAKAERVILAGDHHQLPPTIKCYEAARQGLDKTLLQKIIQRKPETTSMLEIQYRMHEEIMRFPSFWFYHNSLKASPEVSRRNILEWDTPIVWYNTASCAFTETSVSENFGRINKPEAELLVKILQEYIEEIGIGRVIDERIDFGLISPYRVQVQYLRQLIKKNHFFIPIRKLLTIHTVDGFQGQERDVIMISLVRANEKGEIGFLNDLRRMNVAITRARMKLMIIGDSSTLTRHPFYKALYKYIAENGKVSEIFKPE
ncbi:AAA domain-containing protein [uncultured Sanguibacteroides sp.]|uniref:AAA domain-containing protein n=1 Tax=uncultured Sanguibacteroides sp. TaxID=1635151 RepID=UPI0025E5A191|nr:AAA domain-containing protein [uncultured Sanguibacteroides sp.]